MSITKYRNRFPLVKSGLPAWFDTNDWFEDEFFTDGSSFPAMNIKESKDTFDIELAVPGFSKKEIEVSLENDMLHILGTTKKEDVMEDEGYTRKEFGFNSFDRKILVPSTIDKKKEVKATYKDGILHLKLMYPSFQ